MRQKRANAHLERLLLNALWWIVIVYATYAESPDGLSLFLIFWWRATSKRNLKKGLQSSYSSSTFIHSQPFFTLARSLYLPCLTLRHSLTLIHTPMADHSMHSNVNEPQQAHSNDNTPSPPTHSSSPSSTSIDHPSSHENSATDSNDINIHTNSVTNGDISNINHTHNNNDNEWDFKMATLFSIFESTPGVVLREALKTSNGDLDQAIPWILSHNSSSVQDADSNTNTLSTTKSTPFSSSLSTPARKKQKLIQPRLSAFMPTPSSLSVFKPGISPSLSHQHSSSSGTNNNNSEDAPSSSSETTLSSLPSLNDRLRWKEPPLSTDPISTSIDSTTPSSSVPTIKLKPPKPLILYNPEDVAKHCPCTLIFNVLDKDLANRLLKAMLIDSETWNRNRWWLFERMVESPHKTSYFAERDDDMEEVAGWTYNGKKQDPPRRFLPEMEEAKFVVRRIVNELRKERDM